MSLILGIDPQETLLGIHLCKNDGEPLEWFRLWFKKKTTFKHVQEWQEHIWKESYNTLKGLLTKYDRYPINSWLAGIEQQRGRVNSIVENTLLGLCMFLGMNRIILHPKTWKKKVGLISNSKSNYDHKKASEEMVKPLLISFCPNLFTQSNTTKEEKRIHDLCDARLISIAIINISKQ